MDRMMSDAGSQEFYETGGADFMDTKSLYDPSDGENANFVDRCRGGIYGWDDLASENDLYNGQMELNPLTMEAMDDAAVSQNNFAVRHSQYIHTDDDAFRASSPHLLLGCRTSPHCRDVVGIAAVSSLAVVALLFHSLSGQDSTYCKTRCTEKVGIL
eukprot:764044-Hanusia_phi.AAC.4